MITRKLEPNRTYFARCDAYELECGCGMTGVLQFSTDAHGKPYEYCDYFYPDCKCESFDPGADALTEFIGDDELMSDDDVEEWRFSATSPCKEPYHSKCPECADDVHDGDSDGN